MTPSRLSASLRRLLAASAAAVLATTPLVSKADEPAPPSIALAPAVTITTDAGLPPVVAYASTSHRALVVWSAMITTGASDPPIRAAILDDEGVVVVPPFTVAPTGRAAAVASDGKGFLVAHGDAGEPGITVRTVDATGAVSSPTLVVASDSGEDGRNERPQVAWDGATYRLAWRGYGPLWLTSIAPPAAPGPILTLPNVGAADFACAGDTCLIAGSKLSRWKRGASPEVPVPYDYVDVRGLSVRGGAFNLVRTERATKSAACERDPATCSYTVALASVGTTGPLAVDWAAAQRVDLPAAQQLATGVTGNTPVFVWEPVDSSAALFLSVPGATPVPLLPYVPRKTYGIVAMTSAAPGRILLVAAGGLATGNIDPPFELVARVATVEKVAAPSGTDGSGSQGRNGDDPAGTGPSSGGTTSSSSGCSASGPSTASPTASLVVIALVLARRKRARR